MKILKTISHFSDIELKEILDSQKEIRAFKDWQIIYSVQTNKGMLTEDFARVLGVSKSKIWNVIQKYNKHGKNWRTYGKWGGRREQRCLLKLDDEKNLMQSLEIEAQDGKILIFRHIKERVELFAGRKVSDDYIWDLFSRHGWSKKVPRQHHPKGDKVAQEDYKKNSRKIWTPKH